MADSVKSNAYLLLSHEEMLSNPRQALVHVNKSISTFSLKEFPYRRYIRKASIFRILGQVDSSIHYCNLILNKATHEKSPFWISESYGEFGLISISQNNFNKAIEYFNKQLTTVKKYKIKVPYSGVYNNIGIAYGNKGDWDMAFEYFSRSLKYDLANNRVQDLGNDYNNLGIVYLVNQKPDSASKYFLKSLEYRYKQNDILGIGGSLNNLALLEKDRDNYPKALQYADSSLNLAERYGFKKLQVEVYDTYDQVYSQMGDYKKAYQYLRKKNQLNSLFEKEEFSNKIQQLESDIQLEQKQSQILEKDLALTKSEKQKQKQLSIIILAAVLLIALSFFLFTFLKNNKILKERNSIISKQKHLLEQKHKDITDSINYAQKIQSALIISEEKLNARGNNSFVIFKPRDVVSGDFYWFSEHKGYKIIALADCTGHGVPGAFMSMIGITLLNQIVNEKGVISPAMILNNLRKEIIQALSADASDKRDGMDIAVIAFNEHELLYAGANSPVLLVNNNEITELKPNKQPVGNYEKQEDFSEQRLSITKDLKVYLFSDGVVDQFGGPHGKKLKVKLFKQWLSDTSSLAMKEQKTRLELNIDNWRAGFDQTDDISLIGIKLG